MHEVHEPETWQKIKTLLASALDLPTAQRPQLLDVACDRDLALRREVESLLALEEALGAFLERPVVSLRKLLS